MMILAAFLMAVVVTVSAIQLMKSPPVDAPVSIQDGHARMLQLLAEVRDRCADEHSDIGDLAYRNAVAQFASSPPYATLAETWDMHRRLSDESLRIGKTQEAIDHQLAACNLIPQFDNVTPEQKAAIDFGVRQLGVAFLRLAETQNCVQCNTCESCIFPIQNSGVYVKQSASRSAIRYLTITLDRNPEDLEARWLLNIAFMSVGEYPAKVPPEFLIPPEVLASDEKFPRFTNVAGTLGINTFSLSGGSIVDDFDNDGFLDLVVSTTHPGGQMQYYHNDADGSFSERTRDAGLIGLMGGLNMIQGDYDNDGDVDILVLRGAWLADVGRTYPNSLLRNDGHGHFRDVTLETGLGDFHYPTQTAAWADFDNDGDLDLYVGNEQFPCQLFENDGHGRFTDIAARAGVQNLRFAKGVVWGDYNNDRLPDIYVSNLSGVRNIPESEGRNRLYRNNGDGTFTDVAPELDVVRPYSGFPVWFWDFNNDGHLDLYAGSCLWSVRDVAADYLSLPHNAEPDCLYEGDGQGGFREVAKQQKLTRVTHPMGANFGDLDNDGFPDFYLGTGYPEYSALMPNLMFHNLRGNGFADVTTAGGFGHLQKGHGVSFADLDNDGDEDVFAQLGGAFAGDAFGDALFENPGFGNHWIVVRLVGTDSNRSGIGARIRLDIDESGARRSVYKTVNSGGSFGANPLRQHLGVGKAELIDRLEIFWPTTGRTQEFRNVPVDQGIEITEGAGDYRKLSLRSVRFSEQGLK